MSTGTVDLLLERQSRDIRHGFLSVLKLMSNPKIGYDVLKNHHSTPKQPIDTLIYCSFSY